jgi:hypothetical protein
LIVMMGYTDLYYLVYALLRKRKAKFQLYKLIDGKK